MAKNLNESKFYGLRVSLNLRPYYLPQPFVCMGNDNFFFFERLKINF